MLRGLQSLSALGIDSSEEPPSTSSHCLLASVRGPPTEDHLSLLAKMWFRSYRHKPFKHKGSAWKGLF